MPVHHSPIRSRLRNPSTERQGPQSQQATAADPQRHPMNRSKSSPTTPHKDRAKNIKQLTSCYAVSQGQNSQPRVEAAVTTLGMQQLKKLQDVREIHQSDS
ncbi:hypothetical protein Nepgr_020431 [Nepenthes gracilis]|uniref:Uncharacterized protein n=1 Tax=Nepenthes gracilis TaxID=150966 RepID=A0AAD3SVB1_NEPGR|nr:hypothetical protein Nepgr_020431 [Nepenthes gracilis]